MPEAAAQNLHGKFQLGRLLRKLALVLLVNGNVFDLRKEPYDLARRIAHRRHVNDHVYDLPVGAQVTFLDRVAVANARKHVPEEQEVGLQILGMGKVRKGRS
nr:hypothetical protein [Pseudorhizobium marinum]